MGQVLQKKKKRSSLPKARHKPKSKKKLVLNPIVAANWDKNQTLAQNYRRLGLSSRLNAPTGGIEKSESSSSEVRTNIQQRSDHDRLSIKPSVISTVTPMEARIERDPETGKILRVIDEQPKAVNPLNDPLNVLDDQEDDDDWHGFDDSHIALGHLGSRSSDSAVVQQLEQQAKFGVKRAPRNQSQREKEWLGNLVARYGDDYRAMFRDTNLNPMQQSEGELRKRVIKFMDSKSRKA